MFLDIFVPLRKLFNAVVSGTGRIRKKSERSKDESLPDVEQTRDTLHFLLHFVSYLTLSFLETDASAKNSVLSRGKRIFTPEQRKRRTGTVRIRKRLPIPLRGHIVYSISYVCRNTRPADVNVWLEKNTKQIPKTTTWKDLSIYKTFERHKSYFNGCK